MAGQRVSREAAAGRAHGPVRQHVQFEARIGNFYVTIRGRKVKLLRIEPVTKDRGDRLLGFGYVDEQDRVIRLGPSIDGFDMQEGIASQLLTRVGKP